MKNQLDRKLMAVALITLIVSWALTILYSPNSYPYWIALSFTLASAAAVPVIMSISWRRQDQRDAARRKAMDEQGRRDLAFRHRMITDPPPLAVDRPTILLSLDELLADEPINIEQTGE
jgi:hypothetical protein